MRRLFLIFLLSIFTAQSSWAAAVPVSNMQNAVSGVIQAKMKSRGFAANDPRWGATLQNAGATIGGAAAAAAVITLAGITAPAWVTTGLAVGLAGLFTYGINLAIDGAVHWFQNSDGTITVSGASATPDPSLQPGQCYGWQSDSICSGTSSGAIAEKVARWNDSTIFWDPSCLAIVLISCGVGKLSGPPSIIAGTPTAGSASPPVTGSISSVAATVSPSDSAKPLNPAVVATLADSAWKQAAQQPGYDGLPYSVTDPITATDAAAWQAANPGNWPTVGDAIAPQAAPSGGTASSPFSLPNSATPVSTADPGNQTTPQTNPSSAPQANLGPDPGIGAPSLEPTPTARSILDPLLNLFPSLRNFVVPNHSADCPKPSIPLFGKTLALDGHCALLEAVRPTLYAVMAFVWVVIALFIVLAA